MACHYHGLLIGVIQRQGGTGESSQTALWMSQNSASTRQKCGREEGRVHMFSHILQNVEQ